VTASIYAVVLPVTSVAPFLSGFLRCENIFFHTMPYARRYSKPRFGRRSRRRNPSRTRRRRVRDNFYTRPRRPVFRSRRFQVHTGLGKMPTAVVKRVTKRTVPPHDYNLCPIKRRTIWKTNFMNTPADRGLGRGGPLDRAFHKLN